MKNRDKVEVKLDVNGGKAPRNIKYKNHKFEEYRQRRKVGSRD